MSKIIFIKICISIYVNFITNITIYNFKTIFDINLLTCWAPLVLLLISAQSHYLLFIIIRFFYFKLDQNIIYQMIFNFY
jgi:hypothetical protein